ncbi:uncharacterized protein YhbP (UPF0306 family) [Rhodopseudomonas julia]|uniref:Uncharacterized protein YhbP (UPF0306 family) n=1 Tax=Rhodopseudomonas julia TaxID=200617 RepID=A0ABU0C5W1_9BRAD|nr:hypothetical protein [Rhodopseudomonas julia]MDQ0325894.1 uncharacterized protein YhbP (UPF0306 family) [Rhodopseudomonas julia]
MADVGGERGNAEPRLLAQTALPDQRINEFLVSHHVLALACADGQDVWAANCFYLWLPQSASFVILTDGSTRHAEMMLARRQVAGCVAGQPEKVEDIKGVQFSARTTRLPDAAAPSVRTLYEERFPVASKMPAPVWLLEADFLKYTDNSLGFGTKILWSRQD